MLCIEINMHIHIIHILWHNKSFIFRVSCFVLYVCICVEFYWTQELAWRLALASQLKTSRSIKLTNSIIFLWSTKFFDSNAAIVYLPSVCSAKIMLLYKFVPQNLTFSFKTTVATCYFWFWLNSNLQAVKFSTILVYVLKSKSKD